MHWIIKFISMTFLLCVFIPRLTFAQSFIENKGQLRNQFGDVNNEVKFYAVYGGFRVFLNADGFSYELIRSSQDTTNQDSVLLMEFNRIDIHFLNNTFSGNIEKEQIESREKFYRDEQVVDSYGFKKVVYKNVYSNIDVVFYATDRGFKYDFVLHPNADLNAIQIGINSPFATEIVEGAIQISAALGVLSEEIPYSFFQESKREIEIKFTEYQTNDSIKTFQFYTKNRQSSFDETLVIDPMPNVWFSTYISGNLDEFAQKVTLDSEGDVYVVGYTNSVNNIATVGSFQGTFQAVYDVFLVKYRPDGSKLWGTYVGSNSFDRAYGLTYKNGFIYFCGNSFSQNFATTGVHQTVNINGDDAFLAKFDTLGNRIWCTYYGGEAHDFASSVVVNNNNQIYITGHTLSYSNIATSGVHMESFFGVSAAFLAKFSSQGQLLWATYYGSSFDEGYGIALDSDENIVFSGFTSSSNGIASFGAQQTTNAGGVDAFLAKFSPNGTRLWGTFFGGPADDKGYDVCLDASNNIYMVGNTSSLSGIASGSGFQLQAGSIDDGFVAKYNANGVRLWSTYVGGSEAEYINSVSLYFDQGIVIGGKTQSQSNIATSAALSGSLAGQYDAFMMKFSPSGARQWGTYYGGTLSDEFTGLAMDPSNGYIYTSGITLSNNGISTANAHQTAPGPGLFHGFLARFCSPYIPNLITNIQSVSCGSSNYSIDVLPNNVFVDFLWHDQTTTPYYNFTNLSAGQYFYSLTTTDTNNCSFTTQIFNFQVLPDVQIDLNILHNPSQFCQGAEVIFYTIENFANYTWSNGSQNHQLNQTLNDVGLQLISLTVSDANGCTANDTLYFEVIESPEPILQISGSTNFCLGESAFANTTYPYSSTVWSNGASSPQIEINNDTWVWVTVTNAQGCSASSDSVFVSSTVLAPEIVLYNSPPLCPNTILNFGMDNDFNSQSWSNGTTTSAVSIFGVPGNQWIAVEVGNLCGGYGVDTMYYMVFPNIELSMNATIPDLLCVGSHVFTNVTSDFTNVFWQNSNTGYSYDEIADQFGPWTIIVEAQDENSCTVYDTLFLVVDTCFLNLETTQVNWIIYPNPFQDQFIIQSNLFQISSIELFDVQGRMIGAYEIDNNFAQINILNLPPGLYLLKIFDTVGVYRDSIRIMKSDL